MVVQIHRSDSPDLLVDALCDVIEVPLDDPFATEIIAVPTRGIDRWLTERIASTFAERGIGDGVSANIDFPFPYRLSSGILSQIPDTAVSAEAWSRRAVMSHLERIIDEHSDDDWMWLITRFVEGPEGESESGAQRLRAAQKIERLLSSYSRYRPSMMEAWSDGDDVGPDGEPIAGFARWQPHLWRVLREQIEVAPLYETLPGALVTLRSGMADVDLPQRISVYGATALDPMDLAVLEAISQTTDVHLFLLHPSPVLWEDTAPLISGLAESSRSVGRDDDPGRHVAKHPFLRSWAQESRELQVMLGSPGERPMDVREQVGIAPATLLEELQSDIRANRDPSSDPNPDISERVVDGADRSIQIHSCHGAQRQVEVLRDALLHILSDDPTLEPRDIIIMTPDLETFAPLIDAAFPASTSHDGALPDLRVRIADRAPSRTNPLVRFAGTILDLAGSRLGAGAVAQLIALPEVQRRFGIDTDTTADMGRLVDDANIRWGLDADHRDRNGAGSRDEHTWRRGIDRVLTGVFFDDDPIRTAGDVAPLTGMEGQSAAAAGHLAVVIERLASVVELLGSPDPVSRWADKISVAVRLLAAPAWDDEWQWAQLERLLDETFPQEVPGTPDPEIGIGEASILVEPWTEDGPSRLHHRTGNVTVSSLVPMRSVPYRVVCLVGMEHDRFPRSSRHDGDDLLVDNEMIGDRDRAAEDRQLLLDALMAAGDHLVVTYTGRDPLTNAFYPPAVPIAELLEVVAEMVGDHGAKSVVTKHPLQPFSPDVFTDGKLGVAGPWGFDPIQRAGAVAVSERVDEAGDVDDVGFDPISVETPTLDQLIAYLKAPSATFLRHSFGMFIPSMDDPPDDELPTGLNGLEQWGVNSRILTGIQGGHDIELLVVHERATDNVPAGELATEILDEALDLAARIVAAANDTGCMSKSFVPVTGTVVIAGDSISGSVVADLDLALVCDVSPSRDKPTRRIALYTQVAFLTALDPDRAWRGVMIGKADKDNVAVVTIGPFGETAPERSKEAMRRLGYLTALYRDGMAVPIPIFPESSYAWQAAEEDKQHTKTRAKWEPGWYTDGEREEPAHRMLFEELATVGDLADSEFPRYAEKLWSPILEVSEEETV